MGGVVGLPGPAYTLPHSGEVGRRAGDLPYKVEAGPLAAPPLNLLLPRIQHIGPLNKYKRINIVPLTEYKKLHIASQ